ncbi:MAG: MG2 domain-containing protein [Myxococcales bacterium]|jgi:uncharacterized protein YfaS (alpha-2-macroglobulin family)
MTKAARALSVAVLASLAAGCTCGRRPAEQPLEPGAAAAPRPEDDARGQKLAPIPDPPKVEVAREALPGAGEELAVVAARPAGEVAGNVRPTITFSRPVVALGSISDEADRPAVATIEPAIEGEWRWLGSASVELVPKGLVPYSTRFTVTVHEGLTALDGARLPKPYTFEFNTPPPAIHHVAPADGFSWLKPDQTFSLLFNQPVKDLASRARLEVGKEARPVALTVVKEVDVAEEQRAAEAQRRYPRASFDERGFKNRQTRYELAPASKLPLDKEVTLVIAPELEGADGPLTLGAEIRFAFRTYGPARITEARGCLHFYEGARCHYGPLVLLSTNRLDPLTLKDKVAIEPPVEIDWDRVESRLPEPWQDTKQAWISLPGRYKPGTRYKVRVAAGATDEFGQQAPAFEGTFALDDLDPGFTLGNQVALLEASGDGALPLESVNLTSARAEIWPLTPEELARLLAWEPWRAPRAAEPLPALPPTALELDLAGARNARRHTPIDLRKALPEGQRTGLFLVKLASPELPERRPDRVLAQLTDLAVHAKLGPASGALWVTRLSTGRPVERASVRILDREGATRWQATSGADGIARVPGLVELLGSQSNSWSSPFALAVAEKDGDIGATLSTWSDGLEPYAFDLAGAWDGAEPIALGTVFTDRGIYRPGDEVHLKGLARYRSLGRIERPAAGTRVDVQVVDSRGKRAFKGSATVSDFGTFASRLQLGGDVPLGTYQLRATVQLPEPLEYGASFRVEEYRAPQFRVDLSTAKKDLVAGDQIEATLLARYLFGGAMAGAQVRWSAMRTSLGFAPPGNEGFDFGAHAWWWDDEQPEPTSGVVGGGEGVTDEQGAWTIEAGKAEAPAGRTYEYTLEAEVTDINRQRIANRAIVTVHPAALYAGARLAATGFAEVGKPAKVELVAVAPDGARQAGAPIALEVKRREWKSIKKKGVGGEWFTVSEPVETRVFGCEAKSEATPVSCELTPEQPGLHFVEATVTDAAGRKQVTRSSFYVVGGGWVSWQRNDTDRIDLVADKRLYDVGETAKILVKSPYPEAEALLTVEREGVFAVRKVKLTGAAATLEVPIDESFIPNAFVGVVIARGRVPSDKGIETGADPGRPAVRVGYTELRVEKKSKRLAVMVTPDAAEKRPRDKVTVKLKVADGQGKGQRAEVALWAADERVLRLTNYQVPDPIEAMHPLRGLSVRIGEPLLHLVLARLYGEKGETSGGSGGGDASGSGFRSQFRTTIFFDSVTTDAEGNATATIELPDNLTTYRIMAVAATQGDLFGAGESQVSVAKPLLALPALPRFARVGDKLEAGVVVHTHGAKLGDAKVSAEATGLTLAGPAEQTVSLADGRPHEVRFVFEPQTEGTATLRFAVSSGTERDGVEQKIPVRLPVSMEAVATYGDTQESRTEGITPPGGIRPGVGGLDVTLASTVLGNFDESMRQLVDYPYGCLEQMSSRLVPFIALRELHGKFGVPYEAPADTGGQREAFFREWLGEETLALHGTTDPDAVVAKTVKAIEQLQNPDGGFRFWSTSRCSDPWASAYATLALGRAKEVGYRVDAGVLKDAQRYLSDSVAAGKCTDCGWGCEPPGEPTRVFALWALARTGSPRPSYYGQLFEARQELPLFSQAMLADALFIGKGNREQARKLLAELMNHAKESAGEVHFEETDPNTYATLWSSDARTSALVLQTLADISPDHPYVAKIARYLQKARQRDGRFRNTQEAAFSLMALTEVVRVKEQEAPDFEAKVTLGGQTIATAPFRGRSMNVAQVSVPSNKLGQPGQQLPLVFARDGDTGVLYYGALLRYAPAELPTEPLDRGVVVQRWFEPYEGGGQAKTFRAGDLVRVRVRVGSHMERNFVVVDVPLPAGLEAVDTSLASTAALPAEPEQEGPGEGYEYESAEDLSARGANPFAYSFYSPFNHTEMRDDRVTLFADRLPPGVHTASFVARATTPGDYALPPAKAEEMYAPEVFGRSDGGRFTVLTTEPVAHR